MNKFKFAVVGCGNIGKRHIAVLDQNEQVELIGICDIDAEKVETQSGLYGDIPFFQSFSDLLNSCKPDVINIATPHGLHYEMAIEAMGRGIHVLVEKPMALNVDDCRKMIQMAEQNKVKLFVVKQNRYNTPIAITKEALDKGKLGKIFMVQCNVMWNRYQPYYDDSDWRGSIEFEGGSLHTQVSHFLDLLIWWFGDVIDAKTMMDTKNHDIEIEDCGSSTLQFDSGVIGSLFWTTCVYNKNYEGSITIIGENGTIKIGGKYLNKIEYWDVQSYPLPEDVEFEDKPNDYGKYQGTSSNHHKVIEHLVDQFANKRKGVVEGAEAMKTVEAIEMIYK